MQVSAPVTRVTTVHNLFVFDQLVDTQIPTALDRARHPQIFLVFSLSISERCCQRSTLTRAISSGIYPNSGFVDDY
jgi:hypothetical protein